METTPPLTSYSPAMLAKLEAMLAELPDDELLALVPDVKHKSPQGHALLLAELKKRVSPNQPPQMNYFLIAGIDPVASDKPKSHIFMRTGNTVIAVDVTSEIDRKAAFKEDADLLYQEEFRFCAVWQDGWTWEQYCAEVKRLAVEREAYHAAKAAGQATNV